ncbi:biotin-protein ligase [Corynebacterium urealyticum DSM 7109]|uniref:Biotin-protein ligase n=2 Tax=Corynebacterium urealyticum TaxID=43771 RepID=B1VF73_CORU7|nr:biotin--[acetyl-CoA-carboxylase] ligase [Corynebacterium urealyticum]CAQ04412.1 biotin-protein ligase [Corynebacterium urealyticum DSM 7109]SNV95354.1 biotin-protein ligase [Corynebacterium urealyticum]
MPHGLGGCGRRGVSAPCSNIKGMQTSRVLLDSATLREVLPALGCGAVEVLDQTTSTNSVLAEQVRAALAAGEEVPEFSVLFAEEQTQGRGRLDRAWGAPRSSQLIVSVAARLPGVDVANRLGLLPLLTGVAAVDAVRAVSAAAGAEVPAELKWPNDLMVDGRKLGGILVEAVQLEPEPIVVIGLGLNVDLQRSELPVPHATSLVLEGMPGGQGATEHGPGVRTRLAIALIDELFSGLRRFIQLGGAPQSVLPRYRQVVSTLGTKVVVHLPDGTTTHGVARDVEGTGALIVDVDGGGELVVAAGDVTHLRPAEGER